MVSRGMRVHPFPWGAQAAEYARRVGAVVAVGRGTAGDDHPWSLSPAALGAAPVVRDLVLPSPNGSAICAAASATGRPVVAACLRNAPAVGRWLRGQGYGSSYAPVGVIAAGENAGRTGGYDPVWRISWAPPRSSTRCPQCPAGCPVEAAVALAALASVRDTPAAIRGCVSGQELAERGYEQDVEIAAEVGVSDVVPVLRNGVFSAG